MRYLALLLLVACSLDVPKFKIGDRVRYDVPLSYFTECSNTGTVHSIGHTVMGKVVYLVKTEKGYGYSQCPELLGIEEKSVRIYHSILKENLPTE